MEVRANPPRIGWIGGGLLLLLIGTLVLGCYMVVVSEFGASPDPAKASWYLGGVFTMVFSGAGFLLLLIWHLFAQREVALVGDQLQIRRWIAALLGKPPETVRLGDITRVGFIVPGTSAKLLIESSEERKLMSIWFWTRKDALALHEALERAGVATDWDNRLG
jgi:hypothetical protein